MSVTVIVDTAYGDGGKGKLASWLADRYRIQHVVAGGNGPSAAHRIRDSRGRDLLLRQVPLGFWRPDAAMYIGPGTLIDPQLLLAEVEMLERLGFPSLRDRLFVDYRCGLIPPDAQERERAQGLQELGLSWESGTTAARSDYLWRRATRAESLAEDHFRLAAVPDLLNAAAGRGDSVLIHGSHGPAYSMYLSDNYPLVTSDDCGVNSILGRTGLAWSRVTSVVGVCNMLPVTTLPVALADEMTPAELDERGLNSVGAVSGLPRRAARDIDHQMLKRFVLTESPTSLALGRMDLVEPAVRSVTTLSALHESVHRQVARIEAETGVTVSLISTGPGIDEVIQIAEVL